MKYSQIFLTLKGYSVISMFLDQPGICQFTLLNFHIISGRCPWRLPGWKATPRSHPGKFLKNFHFPWWVKQSPPGYWDRVCLHTVNLANLVTSGYLLHLLWLNMDIEKVVLDQGMSKLIKTLHVTTGRSIIN